MKYVLTFFTVLLVLVSWSHAHAQDTERPRVSIVTSSRVQTGTFTVVVAFSEPVTGFAQSELRVTGTAGATIVHWLAQPDSKTYVAQIVPSSDGVVTLNVAQNVAHDAANNGNTAASERTVTVNLSIQPPPLPDPPSPDTVRPSVSINVPSGVQTGPFAVTITFSETVTGFTDGDIRFTGTATATAALSGSGTTYTATITPSGNGNLGIQVPENVAHDAANNGNVRSQRSTVTIDTAPPTVTITGVPTTAQNAAFAVTITFSETVTGFTDGDIRFTGTATATAALSGSGTTYTATITPSGDGNLRIQVPANAANNGNVASTIHTVTIDTTRPTVAIMGAPTTVTAAFFITVEFSEPVTGFVQSELVITGTAGATITSWKPQAGGTHYKATITPTQPGTAIFNVAANVAQDEAGNGNSALTQQTVRANRLVRDTTAPTVTIDAPSTVNTTTFDVTVEFSEPVAGFVQSELVISGAAGATITSWAPQIGDTTYKATITVASDGDTIFNVAANVAQDATNNGNTAATQKTVTVDMTAPTVRIIRDRYTNSAPFDVTVEFSEPVTGFVQSELVFNTTAGATITNWTPQTGGTNYIATFTPTSDGDTISKVLANVAQDAANNGNIGITYGYTVTYDTTAPTATIDAPSAVNTRVFDVTVTFSEGVGDSSYGADPLIEEELVVTGTSGASITNWEPPSSGEAHYIATITATGEGTAIFNVAADVATDNAANGNTVATQKTVTVDMTAPTVTIDAPSAVNTSPFDITVKFSEAVTGFTQSELVVTGTSDASITAWTPQIGGTDYVATITPIYNGTAVFDVAANVARDEANNGNTAATQKIVTVDMTAPTVTIDAPATVNTSTFDVTVKFSKTVTGFTQSELTVTGTSGASITNWAPQTGGTDYKATITATSDGSAIFDVAADAAEDEATNGNTAATQKTVTVDTTPPTAIINVPSGTQNGPFDVTVTFSEVVTGFVQSELVVTGTSDAFITNWTAQAGGTDYVATITPAYNGTAVFDIAANVAEDEASNGNTAATQETVTFQTNTPAVTIDAPTAVNTSTFDVTVKFSEAVTGFIQTELDLSGTASPVITNWAPQTGGTDYVATVTVSPDTVNTFTAIFNVAANVAVDTDNNGNTAAIQKTVNVDIVSPRTSIIPPGGPQTGPFEVRVYFWEKVTGFEQDELVVTGTAGATITNWVPDANAQDYYATITPTSSGTVTYNVAANVAQDEAGNGNLARQSTSEVDLSHPTVTITRDLTQEYIHFIGGFGISTEWPTVELPFNGPFKVKISFSEIVRNFDQSDLVISGTSGATVTSWSPQGDAYYATITPGDDGGNYKEGTVILSVAANTAEDLRGNGNTASRALRSRIDTTGSTVTMTAPDSPQNHTFSVDIVFSEKPSSDISDHPASFHYNQAGDINITGTAAAGIRYRGWSAITTEPKYVYTLGVNPNTEGTVIFAIPANVAKDLAGNGNAATQVTVNVDNIDPIPTITVPSDTQNGRFEVTVEFDEVVTDFEQYRPRQLAPYRTENLNIAPYDNGAIIESWVAETPGQKYTITIKPTRTEELRFLMSSNAVYDLAGNGSDSVPSQTVQVDLTPPSVSIAVPSEVQGGEFDVTIVFDEPVTGFVQSELVITGTSGASITAWTPQAGGTDYIATITSTQTGTAIFNVAANVAQDAVDFWNTAATEKTVNVNLTRPTVTINTPPAAQNGAFDVTVTFSEPVNGFIQSELLLTGTSGASITNWAPQIGDTDYVATITPTSGGTVIFNVNADIAENITNNGNTAATQKTVTVDMSVPSVTIDAPATVNTSTFDVTVQFSESVTGFVQAELILTGTAGASITTWTPQTGGTDYEATITTTSDGTAIFNVAQNVAQDSGNNGNTAAPERTVTVDTTPPTVTIDVPSGAQNSAFDVTVQFSEPVNGFVQAELVVTGTSGASITNWAPQTGGTDYKATITTTSDGTAIFNVVADVAEDAATNGNTAAPEKTVNVDTTPPTVTIDAPAAVNAAFDVTVKFSESVTGFIQSELVVSGSSGSTITNWAPQTGGTDYKATITPASEGTAIFNVAADVAEDIATNGNAVAPEKTVTVDTTRPTVTFEMPPGTLNGAFDVTVQFSEVVTGFVQSELVVSGTSGSTITNWAPQTGGTDYKATITPTFDGTVIFDVAADVAHDLAGNGNIAATTGSSDPSGLKRIDTTAPSVTIDAPSIVNTSTFDVTVQFSEEVTGFVQAELVVTGTSGASITNWAPQTGGTDYKATITTTSDGTAIFNVAADVAEDAARNGNTAAPEKTVTVDTTPPTVTIDVPTGTQNSAFDVTVQFSEEVTGFVQSGLVVTGTSGSTITNWAPQTGGTDYKATITPTSNGTAIFNVAQNVAEDAATNGNTAATQKTVNVDTTVPSVTIDAPSTVNTFTFDVTVQFSEEVTGFVQAELVVTGTSGASITNWVPQTGGTDYKATITTTSDGTAIFNVAQNVAEDAATNGNTAATQKTVTVDTTPPTVTIDVPAGTQNSAFDVTVQFSEAVTGFVQAELVVTGTSGSTITNWAPQTGGIDYIATITPTSNGTAIFNVAQNVAEDAATNDNTAATQQTVTVDLTGPTVTIDAPSTVNTSTFDVTVKFSETVTGFIQSELTISGTAGASITTWVPQTGGTDYKATITTNADGTAIFNVAQNVAEDAATNGNTAAPEKTVTVDKTPPTVTINTPSGMQSGAFDVTVQFSEPVTGFVQAELVVTGTSGASITNWAPQTGGTDYKATITPTSNGTAIFNVAQNVAEDAATNGNTAATQQTVTVDLTGPTVTIDAPSIVNTSTFDVTVKFSETVTGFIQSELTISGTAGASITTWTPQTGGTDYKAIINTTSDGTAIFNVAQNVAQDSATNGNAAAPEKTVTVDMTPPTVTINTPAGTQNSAFDVTVQFSEAVTGFVQSGLVVTGTSGSTITNWAPQTGGTDYIATITPTSNGTAIFNVAQNVAQDAATNDNTAATQKTVTIDTTVPSVTIDAPAIVNTSTFDVTVKFSETVTGFIQSELTISGTAGASITTWTPQTGGTDYKATITTNADGTAIFNVNAGVAQDSATNGNTTAPERTVTVDTTPPTVTIDVPAGTQNGAFDVTVQFSEPVTGFAQTELDLTGTSGASITNWAPQTGGTDYIATITPTSDGTAIFNVAQNVAQDSGNNGNTAATQKTVTVDLTGPSVTIDTPAIVNTSTFDVTVQFNEEVTGFIQSELTISGTAGASITTWVPQTGGTDYKATIATISDGTAIFNVAQNVAQDSGNNGNTAAPERTVTVDTTPPTVTIDVPAGTQSGAFDVTVQFGEEVTGFAQSELVLTGTSGSTITNWTPQTGGTDYIATITPTSNGTAIFNVAQNVAQDAATNENTAATQKTVTVDLTGPSVTIDAPAIVNTSTFDVTVQFNEEVTGFIQSELTISGTAGASITTWTPQTGGTDYKAIINTTSDGTAIFNVAQNVAQDSGNNGNTAAPERTVTVDMTPPTVTINTPSGTQSGAFDVTVQFSEAVTGFVQAELVVTGTSGASITNWAPQTGGTDYTATVTPTSNGTAIFNVAQNVAQDSANNGNTAATQQTVTVDLTGPSVTIDAPSIVNTSTFDVTVQFSEPVTGFIQAELIVTGTSGASITNWTPQTGGTDYKAIINTTSDGTAIFNVAQNVAQDSGNNGNTAAPERTVTVDTAPPTVTINVPAGTQNGAFDVTVTFSEPVTGFAQTELDLTGTSGASITNWAPQTGGTDYIATITPTSNGTAIFNVAADVAQDSGNNGNTAATQKTVTVDLTGPTVTIDAPAIVNTFTFDVTVQFSEPVTGFIQTELVVTGTSGASISAWNPQTGGTDYIATINTTSDGAAIFNVAQNVAQDSANNGNSAAIQKTVTINVPPPPPPDPDPPSPPDPARPSVSINVPSGVQTGPFNITVEFSVPVTGFEQPELSVTGTSGSTIANWAPQTGGTHYIATIIPTADGTAIFNVAENVAQDNAENWNTAATQRIVMVDLSSQASSRDTARPSVSINVPPEVQTGAFDVTVQFNETVTGFVQAELVVTGTSRATITNWTPQTGGTDYIATITPTSGGTAVFNVKENVAHDNAGNGNTAAIERTVTVNIPASPPDTVRPSVSINVPSGTQTGAFDVTVQFSETVTGFVQAELVVTGTSRATITNWTPQTGGTDYTATITPTSDGTAVFNIEENVAQDINENWNAPATQRIVTVDITAPTVSINVPSGVQNGMFAVAVVFGEPVTGFEQSELSITGTSDVTITTWMQLDNGSIYAARITPSSNGTVIFNIAANVIQDDAGNGNTPALQRTVNVDITRPIVTITDVPTTPQNEAFNLTITFSEPVTDFTVEDINFTGNANATATLNGNSTDYTATVTPSGNGSLGIQVPPNVAHDVADNGNVASTIHTVQVDTIGPTVTIDVPSAVQNGLFNVTVQFSEPVTGFVQAELVVTGTADTTIANWAPQPGGTDYIATINPTSDGTAIFNVAANVTQDDAGNGNTAATQNTVDVDPTGPTVMITNVPTTVQNGAFDLTITFSEPVNGFEQSELSVSGSASATITNWTPQTGGTDYIATITPSADGDAVFNVAANVAHDDSGNGNTPALQRTVNVDITRPTVTITDVPTTPQNQVFDLTITFSEPVTDFTAEDIVFTGNANATATLTGNGTNYTATITPSRNSSLGIKVDANVAHDAAGNGNTAAPQMTVAVDMTAPTVNIDVPSTVQNEAFDVTIQFSEPVTDFVQAELVVTGTAGATITKWLEPQDGGTTYAYIATITPTADGTAIFKVEENVVQDIATNGNTAATEQTVTVDITRPTVTITDVPTTPQNQVFDLTITFSEPVTDFTAEDINFTGNANATATLNGSGTDYTATITPSSNSRLGVKVEANVAHDAAGNGNTPTPQMIVNVDMTAPTVSINAPSAVQTEAFDVTIQFSEPVTGFVQSELVVTGTAGARITNWTPQTGDRVYVAAITPSADGSTVFNVAENVAQDIATNGNIAAPQRTVNADITRPTVTITDVPTTVQNKAFDLTITFSEPVTDFTAEDINFTGNANATATLTGSGTAYNTTITPTGEGNLGIQVPANVTHDAAGNGNTPTPQMTVDVDMTAPTVSINAPSAVQTAAFDVTIQFSEPVNGFEQSELNLTGTAGATITNWISQTGGTHYIATVTSTQTGTAIFNVAENVAQDIATNGNTTAPQMTVMVELPPDETALLQNYPNPFKQETWIPYRLAEAADVTLTIYAADGQIVRQLVLGHQPAGFYEDRARAAHWDGKNALGESVSSGIYFYTMTANDFHATRKMLFRK